jgi:hypothetical protein
MGYMRAQNAQVMFAIETTAGTPVTPDKQILIADCTINDGQTIVQRATTRRQQGFMSNGPFVTGQDPTLSIAGQFTYQNFSWLPYMALGANTTTGSGDPYTHAITPDETLPFATIEVKVSGDLAKSRVFTSAYVNTLTISSAENAETMFAAELMALSLASTYTSSTTVAYASQAETVLRHADASFTLGGTNLTAYARSIEVAISNGLEARRGAGSLTPRAMQLVGAREVTVTVTLDADTAFIETLLSRWRGQTAADAVVAWVSGGYGPTITVNDAVMVSASDVSISGAGQQTVTLTLKGYGVLSTTEAIATSFVTPNASVTSAG